MEVEDKLQLIDNLCSFYALGREIYESFNSSLKESPGTEIIVSPANLGDTVFIATLAAAYKEAHNVKHLIIVAKERQAQAVEWFEGVDATVGLSGTEMLSLRYYFVISRKFYENGIRYGHIPCDIDITMPASFFHIEPGFGGAPLINVWEKRILDVPENAYKGEIVISEDMIPYDKKARFGNSILIAPAAFTNKGIPYTFWEKLVEELIKLKYKVFCNSGGLDYDMVIKGTIELRISTKDLILCSSFFKHIVAVRSGFTDLISKTDAPLTVLHLGGKVDGSLRVDYGARLDDVRDLGRTEGIYPIEYCQEREEEIIKLIIEDIK